MLSCLRFYESDLKSASEEQVYRVGLHDPIHLSVHLALVHVQRKKEAISCTRFYVQDWQWIGNVSTTYPYDLVSLYSILSGDIFSDSLSS